MLDPNFPNRLLMSGDRRIVEFIHFLFEEYSKRDLTEETDRCVAISGLEKRIAGALRCQSRYGIFQQYIHRNLLWQASNNKMERIAYNNQQVPSWSWMAYNGSIQFINIPFEKVYWVDTLRFDKERKSALVTNIGEFQDCTMELDGTHYAVLDFDRVKRGWIQYDVEEGEDLCKERCVVVGKVNQDESEDEFKDEFEDESEDEFEDESKGESEDEGKDKSEDESKDESEDGYRSVEKYYILIVRPTSMDGEYRRVGIGLIQSDYVVRQRLDVQVV
jgi:hypothetical protein